MGKRKEGLKMNNDILIQELEKTQVIKKVVHSLLLDDEQCRNNDNYLFGKVIEIIAPKFEK